jgi:ABC-2 type transport system permease protein
MNSKKSDASNKTRLRHGGYAAIMTVIVVAAVVVANLVVGTIPLKLDLTSKKMFSLSDQTLSVLKGLKEDVTIFGMFKPGEEPSNISEVLVRYRDASPRVKLESLDIEKNPAFSKKYDTTGAGISPGSLVIVAKNSGRSKVISYRDLYDVQVDPQTGQSQIQGVSIEQQVTGALLYLGSGRVSKLYELTGHGEDSFQDLGLSDELRKENYDVASVNLTTTKDIPADADILAVVSPKTDIQATEAMAIKAFLDKGGNALLLLDLQQTPAANLESVINLYGLKTLRGFALEGSDDHHMSGNPVFLFPDFADHAILTPIKQQKYPVMMPAALGLDLSQNAKQYLRIAPLLKTTSNSWLRTDLSNNSETRIASDKSGPIVLAYAVESRKDDPAAKVTRIVTVASSRFVNPNILPQFPGNKEFFMNSLGWIQNRTDSLSLRPKSLYVLPLQQNGLQAALSIGLIAIIIPFGLLIAGLIVWLKRRHQ